MLLHSKDFKYTYFCMCNNVLYFYVNFNDNITCGLNECAQLLSHVQLFATAWNVACKVPLSMGFPRQEYWSVLPFPSPEIFPTQGSNPCLLHCRWNLYHLSHLELSLNRIVWHVFSLQNSTTV